MHKNNGASSFEFYVVMVAISVVVLVAIQRYTQLAEQVQVFSFEVLAQRFGTAVYNLRAKWFLHQQDARYNNVIVVDGVGFLISEQGWPLSVVDAKSQENAAAVLVQPRTKTDRIGVNDCYQLWMNLLQNPEQISYAGGDAYGTRPYHLTLTPRGTCRYQLYPVSSNSIDFEYSPISGQVITHKTASMNK
jgi:hypothetical protein